MEKDTGTNYGRAQGNAPATAGNNGNIVAMQCPNCAGELRFSPGARMAQCPYCDTTLNLDYSGQKAEAALQWEQMKSRKFQKAREGYFNNIKKWKHKKLLLVCTEGLVAMLGVLLFDIGEHSSGMADFGLLMIIASFFGVFVIPFAMNSKIPPAPPWLEENVQLKRGLLTILKVAGQVFAGVSTGFIIGIIITMIIRP